MGCMLGIVVIVLTSPFSLQGKKLLEYEFAIHHEIGDLWLVFLMCHTVRPCIDERLNLYTGKGSNNCTTEQQKSAILTLEKCKISLCLLLI